VTLEAWRVMNKPLSMELSPPPITATGWSRKNAASQVPQ